MYIPNHQSPEPSPLSDKIDTSSRNPPTMKCDDTVSGSMSIGHVLRYQFTNPLPQNVTFHSNDSNNSICNISLFDAFGIHIPIQSIQSNKINESNNNHFDDDCNFGINQTVSYSLLAQSYAIELTSTSSEIESFSLTMDCQSNVGITPLLSIDSIPNTINTRRNLLGVAYRGMSIIIFSNIGVKMDGLFIWFTI